MLGKTNLKGRSGFTLIEMAIVLVIIGLLLGSVLKGQEMIKNAKMKRIKSDIDGIVAATYSYQDRYKYLPGDDPMNRVATPPAGFGAKSCTRGNGNGLFDTNKERICFWQELAGAGFISGDPSVHNEVKVAKRTPFGGRYLVRYANNINSSGKSGNYIYVENVPTEIIKSLDEKYDDGVYNTGTIQCDYDYTTSRAYADIYWLAF